MDLVTHGTRPTPRTDNGSGMCCRDAPAALCTEAESRKQPECPKVGNNKIKQAVMTRWNIKQKPPLS